MDERIEHAKRLIEEGSRKLSRDGRWQVTSKCGGECGIHT